jgi:hypothetical protein
MISPNDSMKSNSVVAARKHSLPPVMDLFTSQKQQQLKPYMTLAEFKKNDEFPRQQRAILAALQRQDNRLRKEGIIKEMKKATLRGKRGKVYIVKLFSWFHFLFFIFTVLNKTF